MTWLVGALAYAVALFHRTSLDVASIPAEHRLGVGAQTLASFAFVQLGVYLAMQIPSGMLADRIGPRRMLSGGLLTMAAGATVFGFATAAGTALVSRALIGLGDACIFLNVLRLAQNWFPARRYALMAAMTGLAGGIGQLVSAFPLRLALSSLGWVQTFVGAGVITAALGAVAWLVVRDQPSTPVPGKPLPGNVVPGNLVRGNLLRGNLVAGKSPPAAPSGTGTRGALSGAFGTRGTRVAMWAAFALNAPLMVLATLWGYPWLVQGQGVSAPEATLLLSGLVVANLTLAPVMGWLAGRFPAHRATLVVAAGSLIVAVWGMALLWPGGRLPAVALGTVLLVTALSGAAALVAFDIARAANPSGRGGAASGLVNTAGFGAATAASFVAGVILQHLGHGPNAFRVAFAPMVGAMAFGVAASAVVQWRSKGASGQAGIRGRAAGGEPASDISGSLGEAGVGSRAGLSGRAGVSGREGVNAARVSSKQYELFEGWNGARASAFDDVRHARFYHVEEGSSTGSLPAPRSGWTGPRR